MRICPVAAELFRADGRTDKTDFMKLTIAFRKFATATNVAPPPVAEAFSECKHHIPLFITQQNFLTKVSASDKTNNISLSFEAVMDWTKKAEPVNS